MCSPPSKGAGASSGHSLWRRHLRLQVLNERAIAVMSRMSDKLTGRDFPVELRNGADHDTIPVQVPAVS